MPKNFRSIKEIFRDEPGLGKIRKIVGQSDVIARFHEVLPDLRQIAKPVRVDNKTLFLKVENAAWRSELKFRSTSIVEKINNYFGGNRIKRISFLP